MRENASNAGKYNCPKCIHNFEDRWPDEFDLAFWCRNCMAGNNFKPRPISELEIIEEQIRKCFK